MSYSLNKLPGDPTQFPEPPRFAVWVQEKQYTWDVVPVLDANGNQEMTQWGTPKVDHLRKPKKIPGPVTGQIRHMASLAKAKERVRRYTTWDQRREEDKRSLKFCASWMIAEWIDGKYEVIHEGREGTLLRRNSLFDKPLPKGSGQAPTLKELEAEATRSIVESLRNIAS